MGNDDVSAAFELILEAIEGVRKQIGEEVISATADERYDDAKGHIESGEQLKQFRLKLGHLQSEWADVNPDARARVRVRATRAEPSIAPILSRISPARTELPARSTGHYGSKAPASRLRVTLLPGGTVIERTTAADTFADTIEALGLDEVQRLDRVACKLPLVGTQKARSRYPSQHQRGRYFIVTHSSTPNKKRLLEGIARDLGKRISIDEV